MESSPANHRTAECHERLVNVVTLVEARSQAAKLVQQGDRLFHHLSKDTQAAAVLRVSSGDGRGDAASRQSHPVGIGVVGSVGHITSSGLRRGAPTLPAMGGIASMSGISWVTS
jgi:hypothetical protein